ncbi:response regulator [Magnetospirillum sp. UT-4]|uniref:response regulator n=1 Tax=Magnetospirillum sp. UT-4 TaxID=2681467 RepID=UPI00138429B5|nr:response regulator [Magnetospirillum sp. UT-4]CAA7625116.1 Chemotaxis protein CheY [Magnetospirillum sp. UT-4]
MDVDEALAAWVASKRFLVVEDIDTSRLLVSGLLRGAGAATVHTAQDGEDAVAKIEAKGVPDIILCDWNMPKMDGITLLSVVRELYPAVRFVMLTANTQPEHVRTAAYHKVDGYIAKPFTRKVLLDTLNKLRAAEAAG